MHRVRYHCNYAMGKYKCVCLRVCVFGGGVLLNYDTEYSDLWGKWNDCVLCVYERSPLASVLMFPTVQCA